VVSDADYDALLRRLKELEAESFEKINRVFSRLPGISGT